VEDILVTSPDEANPPRSIAVINGKGGVGKTSIAANLGGQLAQADFRVLLADLDLSGNLKLDVGYVNHPEDDDGAGVFNAIANTEPLPRIRGVRPNLDVIPGGRKLELLTTLAPTPMADELPGGGVPEAFAAAIHAIADEYDIIIFDCAPGNPTLQDVALAAATYILIPTKSDAGGWEGLSMIGPRVKRARKKNPRLTYLGAVLFAHDPAATRVLKNTRLRLDEVGQTVPLFEAFIRSSEAIAHDCRNRGQLAHELAGDVDAVRRARFAILSERARDKKRQADDPAYVPPPREMPEALASAKTAASLARDYHRLAKEIAMRISDLENAAQPAVGE
jgi:cellulose biosynthesis protein BcsQ